MIDSVCQLPNMSGVSGAHNDLVRRACDLAGSSREAHRITQGRKHAGKFVLKRGSTGKYHFNLIASNGQVIATSEAYNSKAAAVKGIESVKTNAPTAEIEDQTKG